jgi:PAS domain S-box-containing protein
MNAVKSAWSFLTRTASLDRNEARYEFMLQAILVSLALIAVTGTVIGTLGVVFGSVKVDTVLILLAMSMLFTAGWYLAGRGYWRIARYIPVTIFLLSAVYGIYLGGVGTPSILLLAIAIVLSAMFFGMKGLGVTMPIVLSSYILLGELHHRGIIIALRSDQSAYHNRVLIAVAAMLAIGVFVQFLISQMEKAIGTSQLHEEELAATMEELQATMEELEATNEEFEATNEELLRINSELNESERKYRGLVESIHEVIFSTDETGVLTYVSPAVRSILGFGPELYIGKNFAEFIYGEDLEKMIASFMSVAAGNTESAEYRILRPEGTPIWVSSTSSPNIDNGRFRGINGVLTDIQARRLAEQELHRKQGELRESEEHFRSMIQSSSDMIFVLDSGGRFTYESPSVGRILGYHAGYFLGRTPFELIHPEDMDVVMKEMDDVYRSVNSGLPTEFRLRHSDGSWTPLEALASNLLENRAVRGIVITARDVTERKRSIQALRDSEERFRVLAESSPVPIAMARGETVIFVNAAFAVLGGYETREDAVGISLLDFVAPEERERVAGYMRNRREDGDVPVYYESVGIRRDGSRFPYEITVAIVMMPDGPITVAFIRDITERRRAEAALRERERVLRSIFNASPAGIATVVGRRIQQVNTMFCWITGYSEEELLGQSSRMIYSSDEEFEKVGRELYGEMERNGRGMMEAHLRRRDGAERNVLMGIAPIDPGDPTAGACATLLDITERKVAESQSEAAREALREKESIMRGLLEATPAGVGMIRDRRFVQVNAALCRMTGYSEGEMLGQPTRMIYKDDDDYQRAGRELYGSMERSGLGTMEVQMLRKDGSVFDALLSLAPFDPTDPSAGACATALDISKRKRAEEALREREGVLRSILEASPVGIGLLVDRRFRQVNRALCRMTGHSEEELLGEYTRILYPDDAEYERVGRDLYGEMRQKGVGIMEVRLQRKSGEVFFVLLGLAPFDPADHSAGICATVMDITELKEAEEALKLSELTYREIFNKIDETIWIHDIETLQFIDVNENATKMFGYTHDELMNLTLGDISSGMPPFTEETGMMYLEKAAAGEPQHFEWHSRHKDGHLFWSDVSLKHGIIAGKECILAIERVITERKEAEEALRESEERFRLMADSAPIMMGLSDVKGTVIYFNRSWLEFRGTSFEEETGKGWKKGVHPDDLEWVQEAMRERISAWEPYHLQFRVRRHDGDFRWVLNSAVPRRTGNGGYVGYINVAMDITDRILFEEEIQKLNVSLERKVQERTDELRRAYDDLVKTNNDLETALRTLGDTQQQLVLSEKLAALGQLAAGMAHELNTPLGAIMSSNRSMIDIIHNSLPALADLVAGLGNNDKHWFDSLLAESLDGAVEIDRSIDRQTRRDIRLQLQEAGAGDNRAFAEIIADLGLYRYLRAHPEPLKSEHLGDILKGVSSLASLRRLGEIVAIATEKASHVVGALRSYLRQDEPGDLSPVDLKNELDMVLTLYHNKLKYGVEVLKEYDEAGYVLGNRNGLNQVWMNLFNNALQAMDYRGTLEIRTEKQEGWIVVSIVDSGTGISGENINRIFEPFFTTKKYGEGIGLGLDISRKIVDALGGRIEVESVPGRTEFRVWLRAAAMPS